MRWILSMVTVWINHFALKTVVSVVFDVCIIIGCMLSMSVFFKKQMISSVSRCIDLPQMLDGQQSVCLSAADCSCCSYHG